MKCLRPRMTRLGRQTKSIQQPDHTQGSMRRKPGQRHINWFELETLKNIVINNELMQRRRVLECLARLCLRQSWSSKSKQILLISTGSMWSTHPRCKFCPQRQECAKASARSYMSRKNQNHYHLAMKIEEVLVTVILHGGRQMFRQLRKRNCSAAECGCK